MTLLGHPRPCSKQPASGWTLQTLRTFMTLSTRTSRELMIETKAITDMAVKLVNDEELEFQPRENHVPRSVGRSLGKLQQARGQ